MRMFTPAQEVAFAGHPILGTAWVVRHYVAAENARSVSLNLIVGQVPVVFESSRTGREVARSSRAPCHPWTNVRSGADGGRAWDIDG